MFLFPYDVAESRRASTVDGRYTLERALAILLKGSGLSGGLSNQGVVAIRVDDSAVNADEGGGSVNTSSKILASLAGFPVGSSAAQRAVAQDQGGGKDNRALALEEVVVTAQKKEEGIQDVPIAVSAFSGEGLDNFKIERGEELLRAVPNVSFSKSNFSTYNFSIRGIGTKAISAGTDPAVAVSFNNTPLIRNRLFEQEFFDVQRVEVLRGPQGTLYGRNATGGVVNAIPVLPEPNLGGEIEAEVGNFNTRRLSGNLNLPVTDTLSMRFSGVLTKRDGIDTNTFTNNDINDRDLYSTRTIVRWEPSDGLSANFIWQHFNEDDRRSRTGKQLCTRDPGPEMVGDTMVATPMLRARLSQGCLPGSLYDSEAFGAPNAAGFANIWFSTFLSPVGFREDGSFAFIIEPGDDPYFGVKQSRDLREIETSYDPVFHAENDLFQLNLKVLLGDSLEFFSQSTYASDDYYSSQDYNRFVSASNFTDSTGLFNSLGDLGNPNPPTPGGVYTDPQLGPSRGVLSVDISQSDSEQWSQKFRLQSSFDSEFNFGLGANYFNFKSQDDYYVFNNTFTFIAEYVYNREDGDSPFMETRNCDIDEQRECVYVDPNPLGQLDEQGHNYFLSRNQARTKSWAVFGESYWQIAERVKITAGLRYTQDEKVATPIPSQLLLGSQAGGTQTGDGSGGRVSRGYPAQPDIKQNWNRFTGRFVIDWQTETPFTDETLVYFSFAHGYKGGGSNSPRVDIDPRVVQFQPLGETFKPEFVNAIEIGAKNSLNDGSLIFNATAFYYNYRDYQVSQIVDRISFNENFDAESWGLEIETAWRPTPNSRIDLNMGYLDTRIGKGEESIDVMNRTQGNENWMLVRPHVQVPSNCIAPVQAVERVIALEPVHDRLVELALASLCAGTARWGSFTPEIESGLRWYETFGFIYNPLTEAPNAGRGFAANLSGNELPNSPNFTFNLGLQHIFQLSDWELKLRADYYRQSDSYARVYNSAYDKLEGWDNLNAAVTLTHPLSQLQMQLYIKNLFDDAPITDFFTNSDDTGLTANVFTLEPRIFGFSVNKKF
ncbi:TonB-dependent receptor [Exilibacterium tricleocarpae]|uniref:TonB-dependent receptor n=2 Tax=Exilibacterium tricleocarpae TaxID=2591008 RepID=A0A545TNZ4_9GAMM|nr:TonB-dependent receptor [Exilibacterium tricleocarpae]